MDPSGQTTTLEYSEEELKKLQAFRTQVRNSGWFKNLNPKAQEHYIEQEAQRLFQQWYNSFRQVGGYRTPISNNWSPGGGG
jgi:hypothetical protein